MNHTSKTTIVIAWICRIAAAVILLQTLFFKFTGAPESVYIFSKVGLEPWGRIGSGVAELIAAILILFPPTTWLGAGLALAVMAGANLQSSHDPRHRRNGRWRSALRPGAGRRGLQRGVALFATP